MDVHSSETPATASTIRSVSTLKAVCAYILFLLLGCAPQLMQNALFSQTPAFVVYSPERHSISGYIVTCFMAAQIATIAYMLLDNIAYNGKLRPFPGVLGVFVVSGGASLLASFAWQENSKGTSFVILTCAVLAGAAGNCSTVIFYKFAAAYPALLTSALSTGYGLSAVITAVLSIGQNMADPQHLSLSVENYFLVIFGILICLLGAFALILLHPFMKSLSRTSGAQHDIVHSFPPSHKEPRNDSRDELSQPLLPHACGERLPELLYPQVSTNISVPASTCNRHVEMAALKSTDGKRKVSQEIDLEKHWAPLLSAPGFAAIAADLNEARRRREGRRWSFGAIDGTPILRPQHSSGEKPSLQGSSSITMSQRATKRTMKDSNSILSFPSTGSLPDAPIGFLTEQDTSNKDSMIATEKPDQRQTRKPCYNNLVDYSHHPATNIKANNMTGSISDVHYNAKPTFDKPSLKQILFHTRLSLWSAVGLGSMTFFIPIAIPYMGGGTEIQTWLNNVFLIGPVAGAGITSICTMKTKLFVSAAILQAASFIIVILPLLTFSQHWLPQSFTNESAALFTMMSVVCTLSGFNSTATYLHVRYQVHQWLHQHLRQNYSNVDTNVRSDSKHKLNTAEQEMLDEITERATGIAGGAYQMGMALGIILGDIFAITNVFIVAS